MKTFEEYLKEVGQEDLLESRPYKRAVSGLSTNQNVVLTGEKNTRVNEDPIAQAAEKDVPKGSNA